MRDERRIALFQETRVFFFLEKKTLRQAYSEHLVSVIIIVSIIVSGQRDSACKGLEGRETAWCVKESKETCDQPQSGEILGWTNRQGTDCGECWPREATNVFSVSSTSPSPK